MPHHLQHPTFKPSPFDPTPFSRNVLTSYLIPKWLLFSGMAPHAQEHEAKQIVQCELRQSKNCVSWMCKVSNPCRDDLTFWLVSDWICMALSFVLAMIHNVRWHRQTMQKPTVSPTNRPDHDRSSMICLIFSLVRLVRLRVHLFVAPRKH